MMKQKIMGWGLNALLGSLLFVACGSGSGDEPEPVKPAEPDVPGVVEPGPPAGKAVFICTDLKGYDLKSEDSEYCWQRTKATDDVILFWEKGFGNDLSQAPALEGNNMKVDADNLLKKVQEFYDFYKNELKFIKPGSTADKYRMIVFLKYSLEGTAYGGSVDNKIGALWVTPNRVQDKNMNAVAHEIGHAFQFQIWADNQGDAWGGGPFLEMTSQWMLWNVNPDWTKDEYYHFTDFAKNAHKCFLHVDNIYHSPFVIECWGLRHGLTFIADMYRQGKRGEDQVQTYKRMTGLSQEEFNDEMWENYARLLNFDFDRVRANTRNLPQSWTTPLKDAGDGWKTVPATNAPENYGFNAIKMTAPAPGESLTVQFKGNAGASGYVAKNTGKAGWRYGFVAVDGDDNTIYGTMHKDKEGEVTFTAPADKTVKRLWFLVMGAPTEHWQHTNGNPKDAQWPYLLKY